MTRGDLMSDDEFLTLAEQAIGLLEDLDPEKYWPSTLSSTIDRRIVEICDLYMAATPIQREVFVSALSNRVCGNLGTFAERMAMLSVRKKSLTMLFHGLIALVIEMDWPWTDPRDGAYYHLSVIYHSANKLGIDIPQVFHKAAQYSIGKLSKETLENLKSDPEDKWFERLGWEEVNGPSGLIYRFKGQTIPEGHL